MRVTLRDQTGSLRHEALPDGRGQCAADDPVHTGPIVIADPYADDQRLIEAEEPGVAMVLAGAGLSGGKAVDRGCFPGAAFNHAPKQIDHGLLIAPQ